MRTERRALPPNCVNSLLTVIAQLSLRDRNHRLHPFELSSTETTRETLLVRLSASPLQRYKVFTGGEEFADGLADTLKFCEDFCVKTFNHR